MFSQGNKNLLYVAGIAATIVTLVLLLNEEKNDKRPKRMVGVGMYGGVAGMERLHNNLQSKIQEGELKNPCHKTDDNVTTTEVYFCFQTNQTVAVLTFDNSVMIGGYGVPDWDDYDWYLETLPRSTGGHWWGNVFSTTGAWDRASYGFHSSVTAWKRQVKIMKIRQGLVLSINTTAIPLGKPKDWGPYKEPPCHGLALCVWKSGNDPCTHILLCPNITSSINETRPSKQLPEVTPGPRSTAKSQPILAIRPDTDDWFRITTGVTQFSNNWLLLAEQAGNEVKQDCVVCLGPRPLLRVAPASVPAECLTDLMNNTNPTDANCTIWDELYPITGPEKLKPIFSSQVARMNYTCINRTGDGEWLGTLNDTWCEDIIEVDIYFRPNYRCDVWWWCGGDKL